MLVNGRKCENQHSVSHRRSRTALYKVWVAIKRRCNNPKDTSFSRYGGRGIRVCLAWDESFEAFLGDMGERPAGMSIDRIDNDGDYEPGNCRWATRTEQARNKRNATAIQYEGETKSLTEWAEDTRCAVGYASLKTRFHRGWPFEKALTTTAEWRGQKDWLPLPVTTKDAA